MREGNGIEVEGLVRVFKDLRAVDGIDLQINPGEIYGFLGPNGAGKSTTVLMLTTLLPLTAGRARVAGYDVVREGALVRAAVETHTRWHAETSQRATRAIEILVERARALAGGARCS